MVKFALLALSLWIAGCAPTVKYVRATPPPELRDCRPTVTPTFVLTGNEEIPFGLSIEESRRLKIMVLQAEHCLKAWREWAR